MQTGDIVKINCVIETGGVATSNTTYWRVQDVITNDVNATLDELATAWWDNISPVVSDQVRFSCIQWINLTNPENFVVFPQLPGLSIGEPKPPFSVLPYRRYALTTGTGVVIQSRLSISGIAEGFGTRGRINDPAEFVNFSAFLSTQFTGAVTTNTLFPMIRKVDNPGPPVVSSYHDAYRAQPAWTFRTLNRRKSVLCGAG